MKTIIFVRGLESPVKRSVISRLMQVLNPDVNTVRAIKLSMAQFLDHPQDKGANKAADKSVKNILKKILINHSETYILIDNESTMPQHWQSFKTIADEVGVEVALWGVDVPSPEGQTDAEKKRSNFHDTNSAAFKLDLDKYMLVNIDDPEGAIREVSRSL